MSRIPGAMWGFVGYFAFFLLGGLYLRDEFLHEYLVQSFTLLQLFVFLWIGTNLLQDERIAKRGLFTYALGAVLLALGSLSHLPGFDTQVVPGRMTDLGQNPNALALHMAIAVVIAVGLWLCGFFKGFVVKLLALIVFIFPPLVVLIQTGSRGGILALAAGLLVYALPLARRRGGDVRRDVHPPRREHDQRAPRDSLLRRPAAVVAGTDPLVQPPVPAHRDYPVGDPESRRRTRRPA